MSSSDTIDRHRFSQADVMELEGVEQAVFLPKPSRSSSSLPSLLVSRRANGARSLEQISKTSGLPVEEQSKPVQPTLESSPLYTARGADHRAVRPCATCSTRISEHTLVIGYCKLP